MENDSTNHKPIDPKTIHLFRDPPWSLRMTIPNDRSYPKVKIVRAAPLSRKDGYISILDNKDEEICLISDPADLDEPSRSIVEEELTNLYLLAVILKIRSVRTEFGTSYWDVETDRGRREFVVQSLQDSVLWLDEHRLLIIDVDGNRFEIPDYMKLDDRSISLLEIVL